jgi:hypothetical protein
MTTLEKLHQKLAHLSPQQRQQVAELIEQFDTPLGALPPKARRLSEFYGILPATVPYPGQDEIRQDVADYLAHKHQLGPQTSAQTIAEFSLRPYRSE